MSSLIDLYNGLLKYNNKDIVIVVDPDMIIWFYGKQIAKILKYKNNRDMIKHLDNDNKKTYIDIKDYSRYKYNIQDHAIFINEQALYELTFKSRMPDAVQFRKWISSEVVPSIRKYGKYEIDDQTKKNMDDLNKQLDEYKKRIMILENNQKREKYPEGGYIYIVKPPNIDIDEDLHKVGKADEKLNKRLNSYDTALPDKMFVVDKVKVDSPIAVELCVKGFLYAYRYKNNKEYYVLGVADILKVINMCNDMICGDKKILKRSLPNLKVSSDENDVYALLAVTKEQEADYYENQKGGHVEICSKSLYIDNKRNYMHLINL